MERVWSCLGHDGGCEAGYGEKQKYAPAPAAIVLVRRFMKAESVGLRKCQLDARWWNGKSCANGL
jgi:hypothetical protein